MRLMLAIFVPWLGLLTIGKPFQAFFCFLLQWTFIGWLPAVIWSVTAVARHYGDKKMDRFAEAIKSSRPAEPAPVVVSVQAPGRGEQSDAPRPFEVQSRALGEPDSQFEEVSPVAGPRDPCDGITGQKGNGRVGVDLRPKPMLWVKRRRIVPRQGPGPLHQADRLKTSEFAKTTQPCWRSIELLLMRG